MPWVAEPPVRGWWRGEGDSAVGRDGGFSPVCVVMVWCLVSVASAGYLWCACWRGCVYGGGLSAFPPVESVPALGGCLCAWVGAFVRGGGGGGRCAGRLVSVVRCGCAC